MEDPGQPQPQQNPFAPLGLGPLWQPGPAIADWVRVDTPGGPLHILRVFTTAGAAGVAFDPNGLGDFIANAQQQATGLTIARNGMGLN